MKAPVKLLASKTSKKMLMYRNVKTHGRPNGEGLWASSLSQNGKDTEGSHGGMHKTTWHESMQSSGNRASLSDHLHLGLCMD